MIGEVSMVNDDNDDNCYLDEAVRFDSIAEDQPVRYTRSRANTAR